jgi:hypothetical protein
MATFHSKKSLTNHSFRKGEHQLAFFVVSNLFLGDDLQKFAKENDNFAQYCTARAGSGLNSWNYSVAAEIVKKSCGARV